MNAVSISHISTSLVLVASLGLAAAAVFHLGADANWDLQNYHLYNPYAFLEGRLDLDLFPSLQAYLNPALDIPFYLAVVHLGAYAANGLLALYFGLFIWTVFLFNRHLLRTVLPASSSTVVIFLALSATAIGVTGAAGASQAVTTFNEIQVALLVVASVGLVLPDANGHFPRAVRVTVAGVIMGVAVGLKLTAMVYLVGAFVALLPWRLKREEVRTLIVYGLAAAAGIIASHGAWSWVLYERFGNPVFPFFNAIFKSPWEAPSNFADMRFFPSTLWGYLTYPLDWAFTLSTAVGEIPFRDPRLTLLLVAAIALVAMHFTLLRLNRPAIFIVIFAVAAYAAWLTRFSILRYGVPLEVMAGTLLVLVAAFPLRARVIVPAFAAGLSAILVAVLVAYTHWPNWGRVTLSQGYTVSMQPIPDGATVLLVGQPISYVVPLIPGGDRGFVGVNRWSTAEGPRREAVVAALSRSKENAWAIILRGQGAEALVMQLGWKINEAQCTPVQASLSPPAVDLCPLMQEP